MTAISMQKFFEVAIARNLSDLNRNGRAMVVAGGTAMSKLNQVAGLNPALGQLWALAIDIYQQGCNL